MALPAPVTAEVDRHLRRFTERGKDAFVFTSATGVPIETSNFRDRIWLPATRWAGLNGLRFHDLRDAAETPVRRPAPPPKSGWPASVTPACRRY